MATCWGQPPSLRRAGAPPGASFPALAPHHGGRAQQVVVRDRDAEKPHPKVRATCVPRFFQFVPRRQRPVKDALPLASSTSITWPRSEDSLSFAKASLPQRQQPRDYTAAYSSLVCGSAVPFQSACHLRHSTGPQLRHRLRSRAASAARHQHGHLVCPGARLLAASACAPSPHQTTSR
jgi:hypothetical protein